MNKREFLKTGLAGLAVASLPARVKAGSLQMKIRWLGAATLEIEAAGLRILTDPCLGEGPEAFVMGDPNEMFDLTKGPNIKTHARLTPFPGLTHQSYDMVLLSHAHEDHFDQKAQQWLDRSLPLLAPEHDQKELARKGFQAQVLAHGQQRVFHGPLGKVTVTSVPAVHSLNPQISAILGMGNGYLIEAEADGAVTRVYWAGDSFHAEPVAQALQGLPAPDLLIPHIGAVGGEGSLGQISMDGAQAVEFATRVGARSVLPVHHSTYALYQEGPETMAAAHATREVGWHLHQTAEGEVVTI